MSSNVLASSFLTVGGRLRLSSKSVALFDTVSGAFWQGKIYFNGGSTLQSGKSQENHRKITRVDL